MPLTVALLSALEQVLEWKVEPAVADGSAVEEALEALRKLPRHSGAFFDGIRDAPQIARTAAEAARKPRAHQGHLAGCREFVWLRLLAPRGAANLVYRFQPSGK